MKKRLVFGVVLFILFTSYKPQNLTLITYFEINNIIIENNLVLKKKEVRKSLEFLYGANLIFLKNNKIKKILKEQSFLEKYTIKKIYPNTIKIKIYEKKPIAILQLKKKKFYISKKFDLIDYIELDKYNNLPLVFGKKENFQSFYKNLKTIDFPTNLIKSYYLLQSNRWDLETYENKIIKLPLKNYNKSLKNFIKLRKEKNFDKYQIFDYRIKGQVILK